MNSLGNSSAYRVSPYGAPRFEKCFTLKQPVSGQQMIQLADKLKNKTGIRFFPEGYDTPAYQVYVMPPGDYTKTTKDPDITEPYTMTADRYEKAVNHVRIVLTKMGFPFDMDDF